LFQTEQVFPTAWLVLFCVSLTPSRLVQFK
jgi:hypothetical protein